jgi:hypothetical protein
LPPRVPASAHWRPGDHLVDVHVGLGAASRLPDDERELVVELAVDNDFGRRRLDRIGDSPARGRAPD